MELLEVDINSDIIGEWECSIIDEDGVRWKTLSEQKREPSRLQVIQAFREGNDKQVFEKVEQ